MTGNYIGNNPNGLDIVLSDDYKTNNTKIFASTACVNNAVNEMHAYLPLGHFFLHPFPTPPDGCLVVNGSEYNRELYKDLFADAVRKNYVKPESEWQSIASENGGYCPWYSDGDGTTTFRTPKFAPYQKIALASGDAGKYITEGLPNITGGAPINSTPLCDISQVVGYPIPDDSAIYAALSATGGDFAATGSNAGMFGLSFDASRSNPIYGNSDHVIPESHEWIVCVVAFGKATNVGSVDVANVIRVVDQVQAEVSNVMSAIDQVQADVATKLDNDTIRVIETWKSDDGTSWYRKYSDGFIEQGGNSQIDENADKDITLSYPFSSTVYQVIVTNTSGGGRNDTEGYIFVKTKYTSSIKFSASYLNPNTSSFNWYACGY